MFSIEFLDEIRRAELAAVLDLFPPRARVLEFGAGTGKQAAELESAGFEVAAIDIASSNYAGHRVFPVVDFDGKIIPFADGSFDVVFSSNVLEHIRDLPPIQKEIKRVLVKGGVAIHILPTHRWRIWTSLAAIPRLIQSVGAAVRAPSRQSGSQFVRQAYVALYQPRHGERGHALTELWTFSPRFWRFHFRQNGFEIEQERDVGIFYSGELLFGPRLSMDRRIAMAGFLGGACHVFKVRPASGRSRAV